jgi:hypothetical protein
MYFVVIFVVVFTFLTVMAWRFPVLWPASANYSGRSRQGTPAAGAADNVFARMIKGEHKEDEPCLTPIDCVQSGKCAGHCGCH